MRSCAAVLSVLAWLASSPALAQTVSDGVAAYRGARFSDAREVLEAALERPDLGREQALEAHRHLSALGLILGDEALASAHARAAAALDTEVTAPDGAPAELGPMLRAAADANGGRLELTLERSGELEVRARAEGPRDLVARLRLRCRQAAGTRESNVLGHETVVEVQDPDPIPCDATASYANGQTLLYREADVGPFVPSDVEPVWLAVGIGAGVAVIVAVVVVVAVVAGGSQDPYVNPPSVVGWP